MMGRMDLEWMNCHHCGGSGKDPKKRTRNCPVCNGDGIGWRCTTCGGIYMVDCLDKYFDQTQCSTIMDKVPEVCTICLYELTEGDKDGQGIV